MSAELLDAPPITALTDPPPDLRSETLVLCDAVRVAQARHFPARCRVVNHRRARHPRELPEAVVALKRERCAELHAAVHALRQYCGDDPAAAERECHALMRAQVEGELTLAAHLRVIRSGPERQRLRAEHNERRAALLETRDALCCGRGWPHRGELIVATAWIYDSAAPNGRFVYRGEAIYTNPYDTHNVSHQVDVPGLKHNRGVLHVYWEPHAHWGNADPAGDIAMRVASRPEQRLPCPLPRWPTQSDVADIDERALTAPGEQLALL